MPSRLSDKSQFSWTQLFLEARPTGQQGGVSAHLGLAPGESPRKPGLRAVCDGQTWWRSCVTEDQPDCLAGPPSTGALDRTSWLAQVVLQVVPDEVHRMLRETVAWRVFGAL